MEGNQEVIFYELCIFSVTSKEKLRGKKKTHIMCSSRTEIDCMHKLDSVRQIRLILLKRE